MNKALHVLVYVFLALAAAALWFELQLNAKRSVLTDRNRQQEDYFVKIARMIEKSEPDKTVTAEPINMDADPVEARLVDSPNTENVLEGYNAYLETANLDTYSWSDKERSQLRMIYQLDAEGKPIMDLGQPKMDGPGTASELLEKLLESSKAQLARLNSTRAELVTLRSKLSSVVAEVNRLKPSARQDKVTITEKEAKISKLEGEKADLENQVTKIRSQIEELNQEITSLKDEAATAKDETEAVREELAKAEQRNKTLEKLVRESIPTKNSAPTSGGVAITSIPAGDKGFVVEADNENMFAIVKFSDTAMKELKGENLGNPLPLIEINVKRPGFNGPAGEFVGRLRLRQEVNGKPYVICDILGSWEQDNINANDIIFAD